MPFNTPAFFGFFIIFYLIYLGLRRYLKLQNIWLLLASYIFYGLFSWRFLPILVFMTVSDYCLSLLIGKLAVDKSGGRIIRKLLISLSIVIDLGILIFLKYLDFFAPEFSHVLELVGISADPITKNIILPVGISFYVLKSLSYVLDVYRRRQTPIRNILEYAIFVAYFPALLAGPIDRARKLLPQIHQPRWITSSQFAAGLTLILWGYFKKLVIADNVANIANQVFAPGGNVQGLDVLLGTLAFALQIYGDFSGYSDIARGFSHLIGFELMINFKLPYFALNPADFWQRWHISLSEWLRDYVFFPLRRMLLTWHIQPIALWGLLVPPMVTMLVSGMWHGTGLNFLIWGLYHGVLMIVYRLFGSMPVSKQLNTIITSRLGVLFRILVMFSFVCLGWIFFRATSVSQAFQLITRLSFTPSGQSISYIQDLLFLGLPLLFVQIWQTIKGDMLVLAKLRFPLQLVANLLLLVWIIVFGAHGALEFIYSQF